MSKRLLTLLAGVAMTASSIGCCCLGGYNRCNPCCGTSGGGYYGGYAPSSNCGPGGCGPTGFVGQDATAFAPSTTLSQAQPATPGQAYPSTAFAPTQPLPTY